MDVATTHHLIRRILRPHDYGEGLPQCCNRGTLAGILSVANHMGCKTAVEIGTQYGAFAKLICDRLPDTHLTTIDPWQEYSGYSLETMEEWRRQALAALVPFSNVRILRMRSLEALALVGDRTVEFLFIDGDHHCDGIFADLALWPRKVCSGGLIVVHDYTPRSQGVLRAVDTYTHCHTITPWYMTYERTPSAFWVQP